MSFVIAVCSKDRIIIAGDTQLNDDNGALSMTGMKVVPISNNVIVGITGTYEGFTKVAEYFIKDSVAQSISFSQKIERIIEILTATDGNCNFVIAGFEKGQTLIAVTGTTYGFQYRIENVTDGTTVRTLFPPEATDEMCYKHFSTVKDRKNQVIDCIRGISKVSSSVNDKICGFDLSHTGLQCFTDGIKYDDISIRINNK